MMLDPALATTAVVITASTSLLLATLGTIMAEKSGVINLGIDGLMLVGALVGFAVAQQTGSATAGAMAALVAGGILASIHAFLTVVLLSNQIVTGLALNIFCTGLANFLGRNFVGQVGPRLEPIAIPGLSSIPVIGPMMSHQDGLVYGAIIIALLLAIFSVIPGPAFI